MPTAKTFINDTGVVKELTGAELEAFNTDRANMQAEAQAEIDAQTAKLAARQAVLDKLGLTADEAAALLG
jgi:hypothetical protein